MRLGVAATPDVALPTLNWLRESRYELIRVFTKPDQLAGRGRELSSTPVSHWAQDQKIELLKPVSVNEFRGSVEDLDCIVTIGYGVLLPQEILDLPRYGFLNLHFSLLPAYRGAAPVQRAIENGEKVTGVTVFALDKGMDTGPIYAHSQLMIDPQWRSFELMDELAKLGPSVVEQALVAMESGLAPTPQIGNSSLTHKISKIEAKINWDQDAHIVARKIAAFYPFPGAWTTWNNSIFKITRAKVVTAHLSSGELSIIDGIPVVGCHDHSAISLLSVIFAGKKEMAGSEWARGARLSSGAFFG